MQHRGRLPQLAGGAFITDGGMETTLIFHQGQDLPLFAAFDLLRTEAGVQALRDYYAPYAALVRDHGVGAVLDTATWRASSDWGTKLGYSPEALAAANREAVALVEEVRAAADAGAPPILVNGTVGPRGDGYRVDTKMTSAEAELYHRPQIETFADSPADLVTGLTMTYAEEAAGIVRAARKANLPAVVSFTVETDGRLPSGQPLGDAVDQVDRETDGEAAYFMINCAHPSHFAGVLTADEPWRERIRGIRANASKMSHAELDEAEELDEGNPVELAADYVGLRPRLPNMNVLGGCCGTDHRHVGEICRAWAGAS